MAKRESGLVAEFAETFKQDFPLGYWRKLHGGLYQSGLPDVLCSVSYDPPLLLEFKWIGNVRELKPLTILDRGTKKLTDLQRSELDRISKSSIVPLLVVGAKLGTHDDVVVTQVWGAEITPRVSTRFRGEKWPLRYLLWGL